MNYNLIWNITRSCSWDCSICCVDAVNNYNESLKNELTQEERKKVIDHCSDLPVKINISGGDPFAINNALETIEYAAYKLGSDCLTLTATGATLCKPKLLEKIIHFISELNMTYDVSYRDKITIRPSYYSRMNLISASHFIALGGKVRAECPLTIENCNRQSIRKVFEDLNMIGVQKLLLMRYFPVGRALDSTRNPQISDICAVIDEARKLESYYLLPKVHLQCALRIVDQHAITENPCDLLDKSLGIMPDGTVLLSPWAYGKEGKAISEDWVIGNLAQSSLRNILVSPHVKYLQTLLNKNNGHCKFFAWNASKKSTFLERLLDHADPIASFSKSGMHPNFNVEKRTGYSEDNQEHFSYSHREEETGNVSDY